MFYKNQDLHYSLQSYNQFSCLGEQKCPKGYIYTGIQGSVRYPIARWKNMSVHQCAKKCDEEIHCKSFEYEAGSKECKISHSLYPNQRNYRQFYFCQKEGKILK